MGLVYNVHYEVASAIFLMVVFAYLRLQYSTNIESTRKFRKIVLLLIFANAFDVLTAVDISYASLLPNWLNVLSNTLYFATLVYLLFNFIQYVGIVVSVKIPKWHNVTINIIMLAYVLILIGNLFFGWLFYFDENSKYTAGPLYLSIYILSFAFVIDGSVIVILLRKNIQRRQMYSILFFSFMEIAGCFIQMLVIPDVLVSVFSGSVAMIVIMFALETPDYRRLTIAMEQLEASKNMLENAKKEAEHARQEAEDANKAKSAFLASMSHEIRTPINGVLGMNAIILKECNDPQIIEYARNIDNAGNGLLSLINDILDFSKIESGRMEIVPVEYDLANVLSACYNMVFLRAREKNIDLLFENNTTIPNKLYGDEVRIRQIITNLLTNAIKYTEEGMVLLTADWNPGADDNMELVISVKDTGMGIKKKNLEHLFEAFSRFDEIKNRNVEGTGLGLKITKQFLDLMNGSIEVDSIYGKGSEFTVRIPQKVVSQTELGDFANYVHISRADESKTVVSYKFECPKGHILVVDDVDMNLKVIKGLLKETKLAVDTATSGKECLEKVQLTNYDIILLDHMMPTMDGIETLVEMRKMNNSFNINTPVIMLTANAVQGAKEEYLEAGFTDYLSKPVTEEYLYKMLIKYLPKNLVHLKDDGKASSPVVSVAKEQTSNEIVKDIRDTVDVVQEEVLSAFERRFKFLDVKTGMTYCLNSEEFYESIIKEFRTTSKYEEIQELFDNADLVNYAIMVHGIKSSALTIGATEVSSMAKGLEFAAKSEDIDYLKANHYPFMHKYGELLDNLDEVYG